MSAMDRCLGNTCPSGDKTSGRYGVLLTVILINIRADPSHQLRALGSHSGIPFILLKRFVSENSIILRIQNRSTGISENKMTCPKYQASHRNFEQVEQDRTGTCTLLSSYFFPVSSAEPDNPRQYASRADMNFPFVVSVSFTSS